MKIVLLALDAQRAPSSISKLAGVLGPDQPFHALTTTPVDAPGHVLSPAPKPYSPDESLRAVDRLRRTAAIAVANRRNYVALRSNPLALEFLADADLVIVGDDVSVRAGRDVAHRLGRRVWGRISTAPYAIQTFTRET